MKIVIDIPEEVYEEFKAGIQSMKNDCIISDAVFDGRVLPREHGRLIDADVLFNKFEEAGWFYNRDRDEVAEKILLNAPTIIE